MAFDLGTLLVHLRAEAAEFNKNLRESVEHVEQVAKKFKRASREIAMVGAEISAIGAEAVHAAAKNNPAAQAAIDELKKSFESVAAEVGMAVLPVLKQVADVVQKVATWFRGLDPHLKQQIARWGAIVAGAALAIGALGELSGVVAGLAGMFSLLSGIITLPFLAVLAVIALVILDVELLRTAWNTNFLGIRDTVLGVKDAIASAWTSTKDAVSGGLSAVANSFVAIFDLAITAVSKAVTFVISAIDRVLSVAEAAGKAAGLNLDFSNTHAALGAAQLAFSPAGIKGMLGQVAGAGKGVLAEALGLGESKAKGIGEALKAGAVAFGQQLRSDFDLVTGKLKDLVNGVLPKGGHAALAAGHVAPDFVSFRPGQALPMQAGIAIESARATLARQGFTQFGGAGGLLERSPLPATLTGATRLIDSLKESHAPDALLQWMDSWRKFLEDAANRQRVLTGLARAQLASGRKLTGLSDEDLQRIVATDDRARARAAVTTHANRIGGAGGFAGATSTATASDEVKAQAEFMAHALVNSFKYIGTNVANALLSSGGALAQVVQAAVQGFQAGNVAGAIAGAIAQLLEQSKAFQGIVNILNSTFQLVADVLGSIIAPIQPLLGAIYNVARALLGALQPAFKLLGALILPLVPIVQLVATILQALAPVISIVAEGFVIVSNAFLLLAGPALQGLFEAIKLVGRFLLWVVIQISGVWNGIIGGIQSFLTMLAQINIAGATPFAFLAQWAQTIGGAAIDTNALAQAQQHLKDLTWQQAGATAAATGAQLANADALNKATASLTNIPEGFRVAYQTFLAMAPGQGPNIYSGGNPQYDSSGNRIIPHFASGGRVTSPTLALIGEGGEPETVIPDSKLAQLGRGSTFNVTIVSNDPEQIWRKLKALMDRDQYRRRGTFARAF